ncbi:MAG: ATPase, T2SS/T4P/T4SS family [Nocardioides sp.]
MSVPRGVDQLLVRRLQVQLGERRQHSIEQRRRLGQPQLDGEDARQHGKALVQQVVTGYESGLAESGDQPLVWEARQDLVDAMEARLFGAGSLQQLLEDPEVEDISINGYRNVFVEYADGAKVKVPPVCSSDEDLIETVQSLGAHEGLSSRPFDVANPRVNVRLADGSRLYAVQAVTPFPCVSIRKHRFMTLTLKDLVALETLDEELVGFLSAVVVARKNVMIAGATSAGKSTLLRALAAQIDPQERLVTVERSLELGLHEDTDAHADVVAMEERLPNAEGAGAVTMAQLVQASLRMNPSRVIVGEVLGDEVVTMLNAMTQGNDGSLSTIHANSATDVVEKVATYAIQAPERLPWEASLRLFANAIDFVVFIRRVRTESGQVRVVEEVLETARVEDGMFKSNQLWGRDPDGVVRRRRAVQPACTDDLVEAGWHPVPGHAPPRGWA